MMHVFDISVAVRAGGAFACALLFCFLFAPYFIRGLFELKIGQPIRELDGFLLGELHKNKKNTPTMGGILMLAAMLASLVLWMDLKNVFTWMLAFTTIVFGLLGGYDDYLKLAYKNHQGLSPGKKLIVQILLSASIISYFQIPAVSEFLGVPQIIDSTGTISLQQYANRIYFPFFANPLVVFSALIWLFWGFVIVGSSNAVNLTDGLDGLATGLVAMVSAVLAFFAYLTSQQELAISFSIPYVEGSGEIAVYLAAVCGACIGFLWFNCHPAQVFMGDIGSLTLGGVLGVSSVLLKREFLFALLGAVFVMEALSVILQVASYKYRDKKRLFLCAPLHHHFEYKGWVETKVVVRFWIVGILLLLVGVISIWM